MKIKFYITIPTYMLMVVPFPYCWTTIIWWRKRNESL